MEATWIWSSIAFFLCLLASLEFGYWVGKRRHAAAKEEPSGESNVLVGIAFSVPGLLMSFAFSMAVNRFEARRHLVVDEANAVGTAYLRVDLLPKASQPAIRKEILRFADARLAYGQALSVGHDTAGARKETTAAADNIWKLTMVAYESTPRESTITQLTPALNEMFDISATRQESAETRLPWPVFVLLAVTSLGASLLAGRALSVHSSRHWGHRIIYSAMLTFMVYVIMDIDDPRQGLIRIDEADRVMRDVRASMHP